MPTENLKDMMMNKEINHECKRLLQGCDEINKVEREYTGRSQGNRKENQELLHLDDAGAIGDTEQPRTPTFAYATKEQVAQAMMDEPTHKFEIMYSHLMYNFEKDQIKRGLRNNINKSNRPRQVIANKSSHKNFVTASDLRRIKPIPKKRYETILKYMNTSKRYTTTMISLNSGIGVSQIAWALNVMYQQKLVDRIYERTTPIIGNAGARSLRYVYFKKK
jgi:hypothetical protein